jgi:hypothetical protein
VITTPGFQVEVTMYIMGAGVGFTLQVLGTVVQNAVRQRDIGVATSSLAFFRSMGGALGAALLGTVLTSRLNVHLTGDFAGAAQAHAALGGDVLNSVEKMHALPEPARRQVIDAFSRSLSETFVSAVPLLAVALLVAFFLKADPLTPRAAPDIASRRGRPGGPRR